MDTIRGLTGIEAQQVRRDALARLIVAEKMLLMKDPLGQDLPYSLWSKALPEAEAIILELAR